MRVLMLGWEFPPYFAGGVGVVAEALTRTLVRRGVDVHYLMPHGPGRAERGGVRIFGGGDGDGAAEGTLRVAGIASTLPAWSYAASAPPGRAPTPVPGEIRPRVERPLYGPDLLEQVERFAERSVELVAREGLELDVIHAHDWTTFPAGLALRRATGRPLVVARPRHRVRPSGRRLRRPRGLRARAARACAAPTASCAVSRRVRERCVETYGADPARVEVVHNAVERDATPADARSASPTASCSSSGASRSQKGPEYFVEAARRVLDVEPGVAFVRRRQRRPPAPHGRARRGARPRPDACSSPGFVDRERAAALYASADVFVMPSVSEPFGIAPLEAMARGVPVIVSRAVGRRRGAAKRARWTSGTWRTLAGKILAALRYPPLAGELAPARPRRGRARSRWDGRRPRASRGPLPRRRSRDLTCRPLLPGAPAVPAAALRALRRSGARERLLRRRRERGASCAASPRSATCP